MGKVGLVHLALRRADEAARMISLETGKPIAQAGREWGLSIDQFRWYAEEARRIYGRIIESRVPGGRFEIHHEPVGIVAAFTAWNSRTAGCSSPWPWAMPSPCWAS